MPISATERLDFVDALAHAADLAGYRAISRPGLRQMIFSTQGLRLYRIVWFTIHRPWLC